VSALPSFPYVTANHEGLGTLDDPKLEGIFPDIFHLWQAKMNFSYLAGRPADSQWGGALDDTLLNWNGMVHQLQYQEIDMSRTCYIKMLINSFSSCF